MRPLVYAILLLVLLGTLDAALARPKRARPKRASPAVFMDGHRWYPQPHTFRPKRASLAHPLLDQREPSPRRFRPKRASPMRQFYDTEGEFVMSRRYRPKRASPMHAIYGPDSAFVPPTRFLPKRARIAHASGPRMLRGGGLETRPVARYSTLDSYDYYPDYWSDLGYGSSYDYGYDLSPYYGDYSSADQLFSYYDDDWVESFSY
ncbi:hypothetical protein CLOP_g16796 [Closterium sp. NIES-67]|nr:hypothetical protein CLOP_g16796 [Closterium sp. NIES-67]